MAPAIGRRRLLATAGLMPLILTGTSACSSGAEPSEEDRAQLLLSAYAYTYPLVTMEITRRKRTDVASPEGDRAPTNQFAHRDETPDADFDSVVRPNVDTLYSSLFFDVSEEPLVITVPDSMGERYNLFPVMDMWTEVVASPGARTEGAGGYAFAVTGPGWEGDLPEGVTGHPVPTDHGWIIGRVQFDGEDDIPAVARIQEEITAVPLSAYGSEYSPPENDDAQEYPEVGAVPEYLHGLGPQGYWDLFHESVSHEQSRPEDAELLEQLSAIGWSPEEHLDLGALPDEEREAWEEAWTELRDRLEGRNDTGGEALGQWSASLSGIGTYDGDWATRAYVALNGLGANLPEDSVYPSTSVDSDGEPLHSDHNYVLRFETDRLPPVEAFWSLTLYGEDSFFVENPIDRYALRDHALAEDEDGSVELRVGREAPSGEPESNWLPAPAEGGFSLMLRLYWPDGSVLEGDWTPPEVVRAD